MADSGSRANQGRSELSEALSSCRAAFMSVGITSGVISLLYLTGSFYMLEVYDRVLPSRSVPTLVGLSVLALALFLFQGVLDLLRTRILMRIGAVLDARLSGRVFEVLVQLPLRTGLKGDGLQPLRDLDQIRSFVSSLGLAALFDLPWLPVYVAICFLFHPWIGVASLIGACILVTLTLLNDRKARAPTRRATELGITRNSIAESARRNAEALQAMGMRGTIAAQWYAANSDYMAVQRRLSDTTGGIGAASKVFRMLLQSAVLGLGAYLVLQGQATAGVIIASSIMVARALAPVELSIAHWKGFVAARQGWERLGQLLTRLPSEVEKTELPRPQRSVSLENIVVVPPGAQNPVVADVSFSLQAGNGLGIIGPSASGKSSLARAIVGAWIPARGKVRLDGAALEQWSHEALGPHIGYVPQDVELFAGTIANNIARFDRQESSEHVIAAARAAGVHDLILRLPNGYDTQIGEAGSNLSAGQRQRIALARALYRDPFLVVLDEPNSNLDAEGDQALGQALAAVRARGGIVIVIAHRQIALTAVDLVMVLANGRVQMLGPKEEVLRKLRQPAPAAGAPTGALTTVPNIRVVPTEAS
jgi:ATP-binding cassette subfamily C protein